MVIENNLKKLSGVKKANVNYATEKATVETEENINEEIIIKAVKDSGYAAEKINTEMAGHDHNSRMKMEEIKKERNYFIISLILSLPVFWLAMMMGEMSFINKVVQSILAGVVQFYIGFRFYRGAYYGLKNKTANMDTLVAVGTSAAYFYSLFTTYFISGEVFFDLIRDMFQLLRCSEIRSIVFGAPILVRTPFTTSAICSASKGGTALPTWVYCEVLLPSKK